MATVELGALLLEKGKYKVVDALIFEERYRPGLWPFRVVATIPAGILTVRVWRSKYTYYFLQPDDGASVRMTIRWPTPLALRVANDNVDDVIGVAMPTGKRLAPNVPPRCWKEQSLPTRWERLPAAVL